MDFLVFFLISKLYLVIKVLTHSAMNEKLELHF